MADQDRVRGRVSRTEQASDELVDPTATTAAPFGLGAKKEEKGR